jgi:hypothetical protein
MATELQLWEVLYFSTAEQIDKTFLVAAQKDLANPLRAVTTLALELLAGTDDFVLGLRPCEQLTIAVAGVEHDHRD